MILYFLKPCLNKKGQKFVSAAMVSFFTALSGFNLVNMTCQLVKIGCFHPIFTFFEQLERQICKIEAALERAVVQLILEIIPRIC